MICENCGTLNDDSFARCQSCGAPLGNAMPDSHVYSPEQNYYSVQSQPVSQPPLPPKKKRTGLKIAIIIVVIILVLCMCPLIGIGLFAGISSIIGINMANKTPSAGVVEETEVYEYDDFTTGEYPGEDSNDFITEAPYTEYDDGYFTDYSEPDYSYGYENEYDESSIDYSDYLGQYIKDGGDPDWGPCYYVYLSEFNSVNKIATFTVTYIGLNASPCYTTGPITVTLDNNNSADFQWFDGWDNSGSGNITFSEGAVPVIEIEMVQEISGDFNRSSLQTNGVFELDYQGDF